MKWSHDINIVSTSSCNPVINVYLYVYMYTHTHTHIYIHINICNGSKLWITFHSEWLIKFELGKNIVIILAFSSFLYVFLIMTKFKFKKSNWRQHRNEYLAVVQVGKEGFSKQHINPGVVKMIHHLNCIWKQKFDVKRQKQHKINK